MNPLLISNGIAEMTPFLAILVGLAIGMQSVAIFYVVKIMLRKFTPTFPYILIACSLFLTTMTRIDNFMHFLDINERTVLLTISSVLMMIAFSKIYSLIKKQHG